MKSLSIKAKITIYLCFTLVVIFGACAVLNGYMQSHAMREMHHEDGEAQDWLLNGQIVEIMENGNNEKLQPLTEEAAARGMVKEMTIINSDLVVMRSSDQSLLDKETRDPLWEKLLRMQIDSSFESEIDGEPVEISYQVFPNEESCQNCHDIDDEAVLGGVKVVRSEQAIAAAVTDSYTTNLTLAIIGALVLVAGIVLALRRMIFNPLENVRGKLVRAADGDIDQTIEAKSNDEIGSFLQALKGLVDYVKGFADASQKIADGDLRVEVQPRSKQDILGHAFATMIGNLREIVGELEQGSEKLVSASHEIFAASEQVSKGTTTQADQVQQISTAIEEMAATILETSKNSNDANEISGQTSETAGQGAQVVNETIDGMRAIADRVKESSGSIGQLSSSADQISEVISVISDIADQTNLLALNAAIEAARAGEQGRGFAVVADEVRKLAEKTATAADKIIETVREIQGQTRGAVQAMESSVSEVDKGRALADNAGQALNDIVQMVQRVTGMIEQVSTAATQQSAAAEEISRNIESISGVTGETASGAEQSRATAEELAKQAEGLQGIVKRFTVS